MKIPTVKVHSYINEKNTHHYRIIGALLLCSESNIAMSKYFQGIWNI